MRRHNYTITELLVVIAIITILAAIAVPSVGYARRRARTATCTSNQGQTMKILLDAMASNNNRIYSGSAFSNPKTDGTVTSDAGWTVYLAEKGFIKNMDAIRCPEIRTYETDGKKFDANSVKEAYGLVVASGNDGKFDFRGTRLFTTSAKEQIAPSALALGGCSTADGKSAAASINFASSGGGNLTGIHHNDTANVFFFDGHSENVDKNSFAPGKFYPVQGNNASSTHADAVSSNAWRLAVK